MENLSHAPLKTPMLVVGSTLFYNRAFPKELGDHFELFHFDHQGFCFNPQLTESAYQNLDKIVGEIEAFRKKSGLEKFILFGHSGHAYMALEYAKAFPDRVSGLVLCGCSPDLSPKSHEAAKSYFDRFADEKRKQIFEQDMAGLHQKIEANPELRFTHFVLCQKAKNWFDPNYDAFWLWKDVPTHLPTLDFVWGKLFSEYQAEKDLKKISFPVLFLQGKYDFVAGPSTSWDSIIAVLNSKVKVFEKSGHYPMVEEPEAFVEELVSWSNTLLENQKQ